MKHEIAEPVVLSLQCLSYLWCFYYTVRHANEVIEYNICHVCDGLLYCPAHLWGHWVQCLSRLWCLNYAVCHVYQVIEYNVCHVCDALTTLSVTFIRSLSTMSVTSVGEGGGLGSGCKFLPLNTSTLLLDRVSQNN